MIIDLCEISQRLFRLNMDVSLPILLADDTCTEKDQSEHPDIPRVPSKGCPLHPDVEEIREAFWSKYTPASLRLLLLEEQNYRVKNILLLATTLMFTAPVGVMFLAYRLSSGLTEDGRWMIASVSAVVCVNVLLAIFSFVAWKEEKQNWQDKLKLDEVKKKAWDERKKKK